jgi:hypothetical protein
MPSVSKQEDMIHLLQILLVKIPAKNLWNIKVKIVKYIPLPEKKLEFSALNLF